MQPAQPTTAETTFPDNIQARIVPVDLYSLIQPVKEEQIAIDANNRPRDYQSRMDALKAGKPQEILEGSRVARELVKAFIYTDSPTWWVINNPALQSARLSSGDIEAVSLVFPEIDYSLLRTTEKLLESAGLLDSFLPGCHANWRYGFNTEIFYHNKPSHRRGAPQNIPMVSQAPNPPLRAALREMLKPFYEEERLFLYGSSY